jgi:peptidoglycan hydrolase-like protein with peptidoglycan-binding domain
VFGSNDDSRFLHAVAWLGWGTPVTAAPQAGDVVVFDFGGDDHHVTLFEKDNGDGTWSCRGGNQSHAVNATNFRKRSVMGVRRPTADAAVQQVAAGTLAPGATGRAVTALQTALTQQGFDAGGIDGEFGPHTSAAVSSFQRARNLPVSGVADAATLQALGVSADAGAPPTTDGTTGEPTIMQDLLKTLIDALIAKQGPAPAGPAAPAQGPVDINQILSIAIAALAGKPLPSTSAPSSATPGGAGATLPLSIIDQIFGGQALAGKKTMLAIIAYVILALLQASGAVNPMSEASQIVTTLIEAFGALGGLAKVDRLTQAVGQVANQSTAPK